MTPSSTRFSRVRDPTLVQGDRLNGYRELLLKTSSAFEPTRCWRCHEANVTTERRRGGGKAPGRTFIVWKIDFPNENYGRLSCLRLPLIPAHYPGSLSSLRGLLESAKSCGDNGELSGFPIDPEVTHLTRPEIDIQSVTVRSRWTCKNVRSHLGDDNELMENAKNVQKIEKKTVIASPKILNRPRLYNGPGRLPQPSNNESIMIARFTPSGRQRPPSRD